MNDIVVIGGGAAGMMAAVAAGERGHRVCLIEKNEKLGKKLYITGKGRCNLTNAADVETLLANVVSNRRFLYSAFYGFDNTAVMEMIEGAGCPLKTERGERVFPVSDHSSDVIRALAKLLNKNGVEVRLNTAVREIVTENGRAVGVRVLKKNANHTASKTAFIKADAVIVCTGGVSYPLTGSTGDGLRFAHDLGHTIIRPEASLVPLETSEKWVADVMGLSLKNVSLRLLAGKKVLYEGLGEMLFTHFGLSGPLVLTGSCYYDPERDRDVTAVIDLKPALDEETLDKRLLRDFEKYANKSFSNALCDLLPSGLIPVITDLSGIDGNKKVHDIRREERKALEDTIKGLTLHVSGTRGFDEAIITRGGVSVKEVDPGTMESKLIGGLYFAGEVLDLDAHTGGFNLQIAWSTGHAAGSSV